MNPKGRPREKPVDPMMGFIRIGVAMHFDKKGTIEKLRMIASVCTKIADAFDKETDT